MMGSLGLVAGFGTVVPTGGALNAWLLLFFVFLGVIPIAGGLWLLTTGRPADGALMFLTPVWPGEMSTRDLRTIGIGSTLTGLGFVFFGLSGLQPSSPAMIGLVPVVVGSALSSRVAARHRRPGASRWAMRTGGSWRPILALAGIDALALIVCFGILPWFVEPPYVGVLAVEPSGLTFSGALDQRMELTAHDHWCGVGLLGGRSLVITLKDPRFDPTLLVSFASYDGDHPYTVGDLTDPNSQATVRLVDGSDAWKATGGRATITRADSSSASGTLDADFVQDLSAHPGRGPVHVSGSWSCRR